MRVVIATDDFVAVAFPARKALEGSIDVGVGECRHASIEPQTARRGTLA